AIHADDVESRVGVAIVVVAKPRAGAVAPEAGLGNHERLRGALDKFGGALGVLAEVMCVVGADLAVLVARVAEGVAVHHIGDFHAAPLDVVAVAAPAKAGVEVSPDLGCAVEGGRGAAHGMTALPVGEEDLITGGVGGVNGIDAGGGGEDV